jgi:hypothetical protein
MRGGARQMQQRDLFPAMRQRESCRWLPDPVYFDRRRRAHRRRVRIAR